MYLHISRFSCPIKSAVDVSTWFFVHAGHVEVVKDLEFLKPCKLNAHTAGCYCIAMDPLDRYFLSMVLHLFLTIHMMCLLWTTPWILLVYTRLISLPNLLFNLTSNNEFYKFLTRMLAWLVILIRIMTKTQVNIQHIVLIL